MNPVREWIDNCDSYICPVCRFETDNPNKYHCICPKCGFIADSDAGKFDEMVVVIRCQDCKWFVHEVDGTFSCEEWDDMPTVEGGFCHKAKMRGAE